MAAIFQIRRGTTNITPADGELYLHQGSGSLQFGSGSNSYNVLTLNAPVNGDINLKGNISASNMFISGNLHISGNLILGNSGSDTITAIGEFTSNLIPNPTDTYNIGSDSKRWGRMFINSISASAFTGSLYGMGDPTSFSTSVDLRLDRMEASASLYDNAMSGSNRLYVSPSGSDSNDGSDPSVPFRTIKAAVVSLGSAVYTNTKRYTIFVGSGEYTEQNPIALPPGVAIVGDTLRTVRLTAVNPTKDYFHCHDGNYFYGLRFLNLRNPSFSFSYPCSTATGSISAGGVSSIGVVHSMTGYTNGNNQDLGIIIEGPDVSGSIATATANVVGGIITQINVVSGGTNYSVTEKPHISIPAPLSQRPIIGTSPYIQNCSSITGPFTTDGTLLSLIPGNVNYAALPYNINDVRNTSNAVIGSGIIDEQGAGGGIRIDGNLVHPLSPLESFVADAFTQVNQGGPGHLVINKGYAQFVSCFTTFCTYGFKTANGGFANISNSVIDFGAKGLVSKTYFPQTYNTGSSLQTLTSTVVGAVIAQDGAGYTGSIASVTISGGGASVNATAQASVNANGSIGEIVILTPGSGYTSQPNLTIAAPTGAGAIQATTTAGKAQVSGIPAILFQLQSGSRGVDVSSNMVLNGTDYLVTNVATGSSANQRYVTVYPAPPSITTGNRVNFHQLSNISTGGLVMEYVGSGVTYNALPKFGGVPNRNREIVEYAPGRVFYSTVDNIGNLKIGDFFAVNQLTGEVTIDANQFNLAGLSAIGPFKRNGVGVGVILNEVSNNATLLNAQGITGEDTVPTQFAVKGYVNIRDARLNKLEESSASLNIATSSLNSYTSSLKTAIDVTGGDTRIKGNLIVDGTQTSLNTTETYIKDKSITLASGSTTSGIADGAGFNIAGANVSMSWDNTNTRLYFNTNIAVSGSISSSTIIGLNNVSVTTYSTSVDSRLSNLQSTSASVNGYITNFNIKTGSFEIKFDTLQNLTSSLAIITGSLISTASANAISITNLNSFTSSQLTQNSNLATITGSLILTASVNVIAISNLNQFSGSQLTQNTNLATITGSLITSASTLTQRITKNEISSASLNQFSASATASIIELYWTASNHEGRIDYIEGVAFGGIDLNAQFATLAVVTSSLQSFTSSANIRLNNLQSKSASIDTSVAALNTSTASQQISIAALNSYTSSNTSTTALNAFTASASGRLNNLESTSASVNTSIGEINSYTSSLKTAITASGTNVTINGNLTVKGTTTQIDSTTLNIGDNIIELNYGGSATTSGIVTKDATGGSTTSGSLLWDASLDYWKAGKLGTESKILLAGGDGVVSGSSQITYASISSIPAGIVSGSSQLTGLLPNGAVSGSSQIDGTLITNKSISIAGTSVSLGGTITGTTIGNAIGAFSSSAQVTLSSTTGYGTILNQALLTTSSPTFAALTINGAITATGDITAYYTSDERLKENIQPITNALSKVETISGNEYNWKEGFDKIHTKKGNDVGVIAQEIQKILPQAVIERDNGYLGVNYEKIIPLLIQSIKELSAKVKELENK